MKNNELYNNVLTMLGKGDITLVKDEKETLYAQVFMEDEMLGMEVVGSNSFIPLFKEVYIHKYDEFLSNTDIGMVIEILVIEGRKITEKVKLAKRVYREGDIYLYELEHNKNKVVWIEAGNVSIETIEGTYFKHSVVDTDQVEPDLSSGARRLAGLVHKHFKFKTQDEVFLFTMYLVSCFLGVDNIQIPILVFIGSKGSAKSCSMKMLSKIVSPQVTELGGHFKNNDDLQLKIADSYMLTLDNIRTVSKSTSDLLCRTVTKGSYQKRKLYTDNEIVNINLDCIVVASAIEMPFKEPDLVDRSIVLELERIGNKERKAESVIWEEFNKDLPCILGSIFNILAQVLQDTEPIEDVEYIRLVDFHQMCIRIGKCININKGEVNRLLMKHRRNVNETLICEDVVVGCFVEFIREKKFYRGSMSNLLNELYIVADKRNISAKDMPVQANVLSRKINSVKSNLEETFGIHYEIHNTGIYREISATYKEI